jgi:transcriptional regulator with XRE-family HTH domain
MVRFFWWSAFDNFEADASGLYPQARQVVAHYRHLSGLSREQVAIHLGVGPKAVYYAEYEGRGLDSLARLRELCKLLQIPPALLGLCNAPGPNGWWLAKYEPWASGSDGWPDAGAVIKSYRRAKNWTQSNLAESLGITLLAVQLMERKHSGLDSLARRRALRFLLAIPPVLLGLDSEYLAEEFGGTLIGASKAPAPELITAFRSTADALFAAYWSDHAADHVRKRVSETLTWLEQVREIRTRVHGSEKLSMFEVESLGYQALANITNQFASDTFTFSYANKAVQLARASKKGDLLCVSLQRRATTLINRGYIDLAQHSLNEALSLSVDDESLRLCRYGEAARILAHVASDEQDRSAIFSLLESYRPVTVQDTFHLRCDHECVIIRIAQTYNLLAEKAPQLKAKDLLRKSSDLLSDLSPDFARHSLLAKLTLAQAYMGLGELDYAATFAVEMLPLLDQTGSVLYLPQLAELYRALHRSKLRSDPQALRLGLYLHKHGAFLL